jgi:aerobic carbon-monoxide dehydrogenase medium subunit
VTSADGATGCQKSPIDTYCFLAGDSAGLETVVLICTHTSQRAANWQGRYWTELKYHLNVNLSIRFGLEARCIATLNRFLNGLSRNVYYVKPPRFEYECPTTMTQALELLAQHGDDAKVLAGGQSLVPLMNFRLARPARLIDINRVPELNFIRVEDRRLLIGAMTRHVQLEESEAVAAHAPLLVQAVAFVGHLQIRNRGTVGGSIVHADPAAELPAALAALDASFQVRSRRGDRTIPWREFFVSEYTTALAADELLIAVEVPIRTGRARSAFVEFSRRQGDFALGGVAAVATIDDRGAWSEARIALLSAGPVPIRATRAEAILEGATPDPETIVAAATEAVREVRPSGDIHGSAAYRRQLLGVLSRRALTAVAEGQ